MAAVAVVAAVVMGMPASWATVGNKSINSASCCVTSPAAAYGPFEAAEGGEGAAEVGFLRNETTRVVVRIDSRYYRPTEVELLLGDNSKIRNALGWAPRTTLSELCREMVLSDLKLIKEGNLEA